MTPRSESVRLGIGLCLLAMVLFACQDAVTKILVRDYVVTQFVFIRFLAFAVFATLYAWWRGGLVAAMSVANLPLQIGRSLLICVEIMLYAFGLRFMGLAESHAIIATFPLIATAFAPLLLGEHVGWRRWSAVGVGFIGALIIIRPGLGVFNPAALIQLAAAFMFAMYHLLTRLVSRTDSFEASLFYFAWIGVIATAPFAVIDWRPPTPEAWAWMGFLSVTAIAGHFALILALQNAPASTLQPLNYTLLVWATIVGYLVFDNFPDNATVVGASIIVAGGLYAMFRSKQRGTT